MAKSAKPDFEKRRQQELAAQQVQGWPETRIDAGNAAAQVAASFGLASTDADSIVKGERARRARTR